MKIRILRQAWPPEFRSRFSFVEKLPDLIVERPGSKASGYRFSVAGVVEKAGA